MSPILNRYLPLALACFFGASLPAAAVTDGQYQSIVSLGTLNGMALNCRYLDQIRRMKQALITTLPRRRALGDAFDSAANEAFLTIVREQRPCPGPETFATRVDSAIDVLHEAFHEQ